MAATNEPRLLAHNRSQGANFDLFDNPSVTDVYVDGIGQINIGPSVSRLKFFAVKNVAIEESGPVEERVVSHCLVNPTPTATGSGLQCHSWSQSGQEGAG